MEDIPADRKVWLNGSFDVLHVGHIRLLEYAKSFGSVRVGLDTDERIREKKGKSRPFNTLADRIEFLASLKFVDSIVVFGSDDELESQIKEYEPDLMVIGDDYKYDTIIGVEYIPKVMFFPKIKHVSTTKILSYEKETNPSHRGPMY